MRTHDILTGDPVKTLALWASTMKRSGGHEELLAFLCVAVASHAEQGKDVAGWVVQCRGAWEDRSDPAKAVPIACKTPATKLWHSFGKQPRFVRASPKAGDSLSVRIAKTGEVHKFNCDNKDNPCDPPPAVAKLIPTESSTGLLAAFLNSPTEAYLQIRLMLSRSETDDKERITVDHAVAPEDSITYGSLIRSTSPPADYLLELCPFDAENGCPREHKPVKVTWKPGVGSAHWAARVKPGLYEVVLSSAGEMPMRTKDRGFLLVVQSARLKTIRPQVEAGEALFLKEWKNKADGKLMFRALLLHLAGMSTQP